MTAAPAPSTQRTSATGRRLAVAISAILTATLVGVIPAMAAGTGTVDAQVTIARAAACLEVSTTSVDFGTLSLGSENAAGTPEIVVTNCGDGAEKLLASGTNATGQDVAWNLVDSAETCADTLGTDNYHLGLATTGGAPIATLATSNKEAGTLALDGSATHSARISTACAGSSGTGAVLNMQINYLVTNLDAPPVELEELPMTQETADAAANFLLGGAQDIAIAPTCVGTVGVDCVGGAPVNPAPEVHAVGSNVVATEVVGQDRWNASANAALTSLQPIPLEIPGAACQLTFNTSAGANPTIQVSLALNFQSYPDPLGPKNYILANNPDVTGLEAADYQISGGGLCSLASSFSSLIIDQAEAVIAAQLSTSICGAPEPAVFMVCPPLQ